MKKVLSELDLDYDDESKMDWVGARVEKDRIEIVNRPMGKGLVPNVKGYGARDAVALLESLGLRVYITGSGKVATQSKAAGSRIHKGDTIVLHMS